MAIPFNAGSIIRTHTDKADFNGDGFTDLVWQGADGSLGVWNMDASGQHGTAAPIIPRPGIEAGLVGYGDVNGDGTTDLVWKYGNGYIQTWGFNDDHLTSVVPLDFYGNAIPTRATGDFSGDGHMDLLFFTQPSQNLPDGAWGTGLLELRGLAPSSLPGLGGITPFSINYAYTGIGDFNGDGRDDILFRGVSGAQLGSFLIQEPQGTSHPLTHMDTAQVTFADPGNGWNVLGIADFNGDGNADIAWEHSNAAGQADARSVWFMGAAGGIRVPYPGADWSVAGVDDYNNDGRADLLWRSASTGNVSEWLTTAGGGFTQGSGFANPGDFWHLA